MKLPTEFFVQNREKLKKIMSNNSAVILTSNKAPHKSADSFYNHHYNRSFYYFTGIKQPESLYIIIKKDDKFFEELVLLPYDPVFEKWYGKRLTEDEAKAESKIARITFEKDFMIKIMDYQG